MCVCVCCVGLCCVALACAIRTGQGADHGEGGEGSGQSLSAHERSGVGSGQDPGQPKQTALENGAERCREEKFQNEVVLKGDQSGNFKKRIDISRIKLKFRKG